jgi:putative endonuclease
MKRGGAVYIMTNKTNRVLYTGVTSDLAKRAWQHRTHFFAGSFTDRYNCVKLVWYRGFGRIEEAIAEEKRLKGGSRQQKLDLINSMNPEWKDLADCFELCYDDCFLRRNDGAVPSTRKARHCEGEARSNLPSVQDLDADTTVDCVVVPPRNDGDTPKE